VCISLCTTVVHNTAQNNCDNLPSYPPDNHHSSDDVYRRGEGEAVDDNCCHCHDNGCWWCCLFAAFTVGLCVRHWLSSHHNTLLFVVCHAGIRCHKMFFSCEFFSTCDLELWPMMLTIHLDLDRAKSSRHVNDVLYMGERSFIRKLLCRHTDIYTDTQTQSADCCIRRLWTCKWLDCREVQQLRAVVQTDRHTHTDRQPGDCCTRRL